jgi:hypothetical protein
MIAYTRLLLLTGVILLSGCAASTFATTWKDPAATSLGFRGQKVVAIVLLKDPSKRRLAEDRLAQQIAVRGAEGRSLYSLLPGSATGSQEEIRAALESAGVKGAIVMRPIYVDREVHITEPQQEESYASFWAGSYGYGVSMSYSSPREPIVTEKTVVYLETLVYTLAQNKLVWTGRSKTTNPNTLAALIEEISAATTSELKKEGLIAAQ